MARLLRRRRGDSPTHRWTEGEDELIRTLPPAQVVERTGRAQTAVYARRQVLHAERGNSERLIPFACC
jgi:hypothetical protein